jgi:signal transduction histidine kinase
VEARLVTAEGNTRLVQAAGERVDDDGETPLLRGTIKDVTESKSRRQQLMVFNRVLRHNLRNDLNVVLGHADRLRAAVRSVSVADDDPAVGSALAAVDDVVTATENLLETSERVRRFDRLSEEVTDYDPVAIRSLLERVAATYREAVPAATIRVEGPDHTVLVDPDAVRIAVAELVDNALEHGGDERPTITLRVVEGADGAIRVDVADRGQGMPAVERRVITAGTETPLEHGSGLGLWLVKWLVTAMGGTIDIADGERCGTVVSLEFPASRWRPGEGDATR